MKIALQMYTVREESQLNFLKTLEEVSKLGYEGVEFAGFYDVEAKVLKAKLEALHLFPLSAHIPLEELENNLEEVVKYNKIIGNTSITCPFSKWTTDEELRKIVNILNYAMPILAENDMKLLYHNHSHEFEKSDNQYKLDLLLESVDGMKLELDTCWLAHAKVDVLEYMEMHKDDIEMVHIKDIDYDGEEVLLPELGGGILPIMDIISKSEEIGLEWIIVENDFPKPDGITNIKKSMEFLRRSL